MTDTSRFAAPDAELLDASEPPKRFEIDSLPVSDSWRQRFRLLEKAGGPKQPNWKSLTQGERFKIMFNLLAFVFGPLYYLSKGMWKKALSLFGACFVVIAIIELILESVGSDFASRSLIYGAAAVWAVRANVDYYKKMVLGENGWWSFSA